MKILGPLLIIGGVILIFVVIPALVYWRSVSETGQAPLAPPTPEIQEKERKMLLAQRLRMAKARRGKSAFFVCANCHPKRPGAPRKVGPTLYGIVGAKVAARPRFPYSQALKEKGGRWTFEELDRFLENPRAYVPGTKMAFPGIKSAIMRADIMLYLRELSDKPYPLPEVKPLQAGK